MSSEAAVAMEFLGVENDERKSQFQLRVERSALHSSLSKIKPQMMKRVLSWRGLVDKPKMVSDSGKADVNKAMGLFPQTTGFCSLPHPAVETLRHCQPPAHLYGGILPYLGQGALPPCPTRKSPPVLTIFYNGAVNVFDVDESKAQAIMMMAESLSSIPQNKNNPTTGASTSTIPTNVFGEEKSYGSITVASPRADIRNSTSPMSAGLPIARKHSLQRFLQKRNDRLTSKAPYDPAMASKVTRDKEDKEKIAAPVSVTALKAPFP